MTTTVSVEEAQSKLADLIRGFSPGDEVLITEGPKAVARLVPVANPPQRKLGTLQGTVKYVAPDFDAPLEEFREYMP